MSSNNATNYLIVELSDNNYVPCSHFVMNEFDSSGPNLSTTIMCHNEFAFLVSHL